MTRQSSERLIYKGQEYGMVTQPLDSFRMKMEKNPTLFPPDTACWRGYRGTWEIREDKLFLIKLKAYTANYKEQGIELFFPGQKEVFTDWFTGEIQAPYGETGEVIQTMYQSIYGKDLFLDIREGVLVGARVVVNKNPFVMYTKAEQVAKEIIVLKKKSFWERLLGREEYKQNNMVTIKTPKNALFELLKKLKVAVRGNGLKAIGTTCEVCYGCWLCYKELQSSKC